MIHIALSTAKKFLYAALLVICVLGSPAYGDRAAIGHRLHQLHVHADALLGNLSYLPGWAQRIGLTPPHAKSGENNFYVDEVQYKEEEGNGTLTDGTIVRGNLRFGGLQPDYLLNLDHPKLQALLQDAELLKDLPDAEKMERVKNLVHKALPKRAYRSLAYRRLLRQHRKQETPIELGAYLEKKAGVCREHALITHFALQRAGFNPVFRYIEIWRRARLRNKLVVEDHAINTIQFNGQTVVIDSYFPQFHGKTYEQLFRAAPSTPSKRNVSGANETTFGVIKEHSFPKRLVPTGKHSLETLSVTASNGKQFDFHVVGRSAADRMFKHDADTIEQATHDELVPIEWLLHPYWGALGHTTLRIGQEMYSMGHNGWSLLTESHSARGYLMNNPASKKLFLQYRSDGAEPFSLGISFHLPKRAVTALRETIHHRAAAGESFSLLFNNCNSALLREIPLLQSAARDPFTRFSSRLTFSNLLLNPPIPIQDLRLYRLSGVNRSSADSRDIIPRELYTQRSPLREMTRLVRLTAKYATHKFPF